MHIEKGISFATICHIKRNYEKINILQQKNGVFSKAIISTQFEGQSKFCCNIKYFRLEKF